ncbi:uncharacterized protein LOC128955738 [Oppia nitens]|uniref:uncharacterized protein LOC128955738 n=1 Tax=Oppia nitens TaxID=1686743 RepID=UPI0023D9E278|nr:uncharacterized protein LOC128955738 [Oppia nitens]
MVITSAPSLTSQHTTNRSNSPEFELMETMSIHSTPNRHLHDSRQSHPMLDSVSTHSNHSHQQQRQQHHQYSSHYSLNSSPSRSSASSEGQDVKLNTSAVYKLLMGRPVTVRRDYYIDREQQIMDNTFVSETLCWHNRFRVKHDVPALTLSYDLVTMAQEWANYLAHTDTFKYRNHQEIGENLMCKWTCHPDFDPPGESIVKLWYSEIALYNFNIDPSIMHTLANHFTQIVWKNTKEFGIGKAHTRGGKLIVVANYRPNGNIKGQFKDNVLPIIIKDNNNHTDNNDDNNDDKCSQDNNSPELYQSADETSLQSQSLLSH